MTKIDRGQKLAGLVATLRTDVSGVSANDLLYEDVLARQVEAIG